MGLQTIPDREDGLPNGVIDATWFNVLKQVLTGLLVGRSSSTGAPAAGQDLGSILFPFGAVHCGSLIVNGTLLDTSSLSGGTHKIVSGKKRSTSNQPAFITPAGASGGPAFTVAGATTALSLEVSGEQGEITTDIDVSGLSLAPSSQNTCLVNDTSATGQEATRTWGEPEDASEITVDTMGTNISALVGSYAAFKVVNGANTEYFLAFVESTTKLRSAFRGYFYGSDLAPINRIKLADNNTITLMKLHWVFADVDGTTITTTATMPKVDATQPASPATGDYWFDLVSSAWKRYDGSAFQTVSRILIGCVIVDTADCVGARSFDFFSSYSPFSSIDVERTSATVVQSRRMGQQISVAGLNVRFQTARAYWDMATDLAGAADMYDATEQASRTYYFYVKDTGQEVISDISPYYRSDLFGWYHPHNPWRCVAACANDGSSNLNSDATLTHFTWLPRRSIRNDYMAPTNYALSSSSGSANTTSSSLADVTNLSVTITTKGRPVVVKVVPDGSGTGGSSARFGVNASASAPAVEPYGNWALLENGSVIAETQFRVQVNSTFCTTPPSLEAFRDVPAGTYTYKVQHRVLSANGSSVITGACKLLAYEI
jgi:hypothetical protein